MNIEKESGMDSDQKFWMGIWRMVIVATIIGIIGISSCSIHKDYRIAKVILSGTNPALARVAFSSQTRNSAIIAEIVSKQR